MVDGRAGSPLPAAVATETDSQHLTQIPHPQPLSHPMGEGGVGLSPTEVEREGGAHGVTRPTFLFSHVSRFLGFLRRNWLPAFVVLISAVVLAFWNFRHTEQVVARRAFSLGNVNDFSWRNRVAAWEGSLQMMADKPLLGFGWNQPQRVYDQYYRTVKVDEGAAIQLNDYFTLGTTLGIPALVCFVVYIGLSLTRSAERRMRNQRFEPVSSIQHPGPSPPATCPLPLPMICRAGAMVLLVGFCFDGGLFKLATGSVFWILLELGRNE